MSSPTEFSTSSAPASKRKIKIRLLAHGCKDIGDRTVQQDAFMISDKSLRKERGLLAVLADGMGGMESGEVFSNLAVNEMQRYFSKCDPEEDICSVLLNAYQAARNEALKIPNSENGGSTVTAVLIRGKRCAFLSVGDSRIYLLRGGSLIQLNREHTLGVRLDESAALGYVPAEEALYNLYRASLTNHLCMSSDIPCDRCTEPFLLRKDDKLLLMSDGIFGTLSEEDITRFANMPGTDGADAMIKEIRSRGKKDQDNCSVVILALEPTNTVS